METETEAACWAHIHTYTQRGIRLAQCPLIMKLVAWQLLGHSTGQRSYLRHCKQSRKLFASFVLDITLAVRTRVCYAKFQINIFMLYRHSVSLSRAYSCHILIYAYI